jgi:hypothetical protein
MLFRVLCASARAVLDALIGSLLDRPSSGALATRLTTYFAYLYGYCVPIQTQDFEADLLLDHRQFY